MRRLFCIGAILLPGAALGYEFDPTLWQRLVVTEVMVTPAGAMAKAGQWIEVHNPTAEPLNLQGVVLATLQGGFHVLSPSKPLVAEPGRILLLAPYWDSLGLGKGIVDYAYGGDFWLDASQDVVLLLKAGKVVDVFAYGPESLPVRPGASFSLEPSQGGVFKEWCYGREPYDGEGNLGTPGEPNPHCDGDGDGLAEDQGDCDDRDPAVSPGAIEVCNGLDDDCNGLVDDDVGPPPGPCQTLGVCAGTEAVCGGVSGWVCPYPDGYEAEEVSCDGDDNDCDGETDENLVPAEACLGLGVCAGTQPQCKGASGWVCPYPASYEAQETSCDGLDNDCDGETDEGHDVGASCEVGVGACREVGVLVCAQDRTGAVCSVEPGLPESERCGDGADNDCDGQTDEGFPVGQTCEVGVGACRSVGKYRCAEDLLSVVCDAVLGQPGVERCGDGVDNDCDGQTDEGDCEPSRAEGGGGCSGMTRRAGSPGALGGLLVLLMVALVGCGRWSHSARRAIR